MNIKKFVITDEGFGYEDLTEDGPIRFVLDKKTFIDCRISEINGKKVLSITGETWKLDQLLVIPRAANALLIGF